MGKKAFTLAEVLITLTMIGVLAAFTIPSLVSNISDQQNKIAYKKVFADLSQVNQRVLLDNGGPLVKSDIVDANNLRNKYLPHLNYIKACDIGTTRGNCWNNIGAKHLQTGEIYISTGWWDNYFVGTGSSVILSNGAHLMFAYWPDFNCFNNAASYKECGRIFVDVNGSKEPNTWGKDIYYIFIYQDRLVPNFTDDCYTGAGWGCSTQYLYQ